MRNSYFEESTNNHSWLFVLLILGAGKLILMTCEFDVIAEIDLDSSEKAESKCS